LQITIFTVYINSTVAELVSCNSVPSLVSCYSDYDTAPDVETEYQSG